MEQKPELFEVEPDCWEAVQLFLRLQTQWRATDGVVLGLDYGSVVILLDLENVADRRRDLFAEIQTMEFSALPILNEKASD